jgi:membrane protein required for colicin V production
MNLLDLLLILIVGSSVVAGFVTGFTRSALSLASAVAGIILGFWFYDTAGAWFVGIAGSTIIANLLGFFVVFALTMLAGNLAGRMFSSIFKVIGLGGMDRLMGAAFGLVRGIFVASAAVAVLVAAMPRPVPEWMRGSSTLPYALGASDVISMLAPQSVKDSFGGSIRELRKTWDQEVGRAKQRAQDAFVDTVKDTVKKEAEKVVAPTSVPAQVAAPVAGKAKPKTSTKKAAKQKAKAKQ